MHLFQMLDGGELFSSFLMGKKIFPCNTLGATVLPPPFSFRIFKYFGDSRLEQEIGRHFQSNRQRFCADVGLDWLGRS